MVINKTDLSPYGPTKETVERFPGIPSVFIRAAVESRGQELAEQEAVRRMVLYAAERERLRVWATDLSPGAVRLARMPPIFPRPTIPAFNGFAICLVLAY